MEGIWGAQFKGPTMKFLYPLTAASAAVFFLSLTALTWIYGPRLLLHADGAITRFEGVESKINASATNLDKASKQWADSEKAISADVADTMQQARGTLSGAQEAFASIPPVAQHLQGTADAGTALLASAKSTTDTLPPLIGHAQTAIDGILPIESGITATTYDLRAFLKSQAVTGSAENIQATTANFAAITKDARLASDKLTNDFVAPKPWYRKIGPSLSDLWDYGALAARHMP
jgi:hypothetical protein